MSTHTLPDSHHERKALIDREHAAAHDAERQVHDQARKAMRDATERRKVHEATVSEAAEKHRLYLATNLAREWTEAAAPLAVAFDQEDTNQGAAALQQLWQAFSDRAQHEIGERFWMWQIALPFIAIRIAKAPRSVTQFPIFGNAGIPWTLAAVETIGKSLRGEPREARAALVGLLHAIDRDSRSRAGQNRTDADVDRLRRIFEAEQQCATGRDAKAAVAAIQAEYDEQRRVALREHNAREIAEGRARLMTG